MKPLISIGLISLGLSFPAPGLTETWKFIPGSEYSFKYSQKECFEEMNLQSATTLGDHTFWEERFVCMNSDGSKEIHEPRAGRANCDLQTLFIDEWERPDSRSWIPFDEMLAMTDPKSPNRVGFEAGHYGYRFACHMVGRGQ